jgi:hypothetical protein
VNWRLGNFLDQEQEWRLVCLRFLAITERAMHLTSLAFALTLALAGTALAQDEPRPRPTWQDAMAKGMVPYHQLTVDEFPDQQ